MVPQASQQQIVQERDRLRLLLDVNNAVCSTLSLQDLLLKVSGWLRQFFTYALASMVIRDEKSGQLRVHALDAPAPGGVLAEGSLLVSGWTCSM
jgi:hypothetical protein